MFTEHREQSYTFSKPTTWEAVRASGVGLITHPGVDFARLPLRVACSLRVAENHEGAPCIRIDYFIAALWDPDGGEPRWNDITSKSLRPEDDETACMLFAETEEEGLIIDVAIEKLLGVDELPVAVPVSPPEATGGAL
jgi:hypothetical protein